jgi:hypothetical protein
MNVKNGTNANRPTAAETIRKCGLKDGVENVSVDLQSNQFVSISSYRNVGVRHLRTSFRVRSASNT